MRRAFESGWPENSEKFGDGEGTFEVYRDAEYGHPGPGFVVLAYRQGPQERKRPAPHDHGVCWVVYGVKSGANMQTRYSYKHTDDRSQMPSFEKVQEVLQTDGMRGLLPPRRDPQRAGLHHRRDHLRPHHEHGPGQRPAAPVRRGERSQRDLLLRHDDGAIAMAISLAVGNRLETRYLLSGRVLIEGMDVELVDTGPAPAPIFPAMVTTRPYDVGELTVGNFIIAKDQGVGLLGLPVFPNLFFPLTGVTVNKGAGIAKLEDLAGKRVGVPLGFASNPAVWLRAILASQYGVAADSITWVEGENDSLRDIPYPRPERLKREQMTGLDERLAAGDIDALVVAGGNATLADTVQLLVADPYPLLESYHAATGVFPINTLLVMREESQAEHPALAGAVCKAMDEATAIYMAEEPDDAVHQGLRVGDLRRLGLFPRGQGLAVHGASVLALVDSLYETELIRKRWTLDELFAA